MNIKKFLKIEQIKHDMTGADISEKCGWYEQAYSKRINRNDMMISDLEKIANAMNCDLKIEFVDRK